jgi:pyrroline-5-carboxylate reductase
MSTIVFLGGGRITSAMLAGLRVGKSKDRLMVHDRHSTKMRDLNRRYRAIIEPDLHRAVQQADILIVAVRPDSVRALLKSVGNIERPLLAVSVVAGVPLSVLRKGLPPPVRWARAMPSPVCRSGHGLTALTFPRTLPRQDRRRVHDFFAGFGHVIEIPESKFDPFTVAYSSSHGYHALATLAKAAQEVGLNRRTALLAGAHALADGITAWREDRVSLESLLEEAATPGGIAATTMAAMNAAGYDRAVRKGVQAGLRRARLSARA